MSVVVARSGRLIDVLNPSQESFLIDDVAWGLAHTVRWRGTLGTWTVAEHSELVSYYLRDKTPKVQLFGLLHDAAEYLFGDVPTPIKNLPYLEGYRQLEQNLLAHMYRRFAGRQPDGEEAWCVNRADACVAKHEARTLGTAFVKDSLSHASPGFFAEQIDLEAFVFDSIHDSTSEKAEHFVKEYNRLKDAARSG